MNLCTNRIRLSTDKLKNYHHSRDDYRKLLELTVIFLGEVSQRGIKFIKPEAMHHARFLASLVCSIFLLYLSFL